MRKKIDEETLLASYEKKVIRSSWDSGRKELFFCLPDIIHQLTLTSDPADYLKKLRKRTPSLAKNWDTLVIPHEILTKGGRQMPNCTNASGVLRIIDMLPQGRKQAFKDYVARVKDERPIPTQTKEPPLYSMTELYLLCQNESGESF